MSFKSVSDFEILIANFFKAPYAIATDSCTHAIELCFRYLNHYKEIIVPTRTYISIPFLANKLNLELKWNDSIWEDYYCFEGTNIYDAAVYWQRNGFIRDSFMCLSFQFQKHCNIGKGGMILLDDKKAYNKLSRMVYDGRVRDIPWREQDISEVGYHYYMTPESAKEGIKRFEEVKEKIPKKWTSADYPFLPSMKVFKI